MKKISDNFQDILLKYNIKAKIGSFERSIVLGIIDNYHIPPILGRYTFLETFKLTLENFITTFS